MSAYLLHEQHRVSEAAKSAALSRGNYVAAKSSELQRVSYLSPADRALLMRHFDLVWNKFATPAHAVDLGMVDA